MRNNSVNLFRILASGSIEDVVYKFFLSGALVALLFSGAEPLMHFQRGHNGEHSC